MICKIPPLALVAAVLLMVTGQIHADVMYLTGMGASSNVPLTATMNITSLSATELKVSITNTSTNAGADNRITYFGIQVPNDTVSGSIVIAETDGNWDIDLDSKIPGNGADKFEFLQSLTSNGGQNGLKLGDTLTILYTATNAIFQPLDLLTWPPTNKNDYIAAAKFQSVGSDGNDSGVAGTIVPEPASAMILLSGLVWLLRRNHRQRQTA